MRRTFSQKGQIGVLIVFFVLFVISAISLSFLYQMRLEREAASNYKDALLATYLAQAGLERAIAELRNDTNHYDDLYENWARGFKENLGAGYYDVKLISEEGETKDVGIIDEASKLNINFAGSGTFGEGWTSYELDLKALDFIDEKRAQAILDYRYGPDKAPGKKGIDDDKDNKILSQDGIDNDADGEVDEKDEGIDEPDEFYPQNPFGDDNPFETVEEIRLVPGIGKWLSTKLKDYITIYSYDKNIDREGNLRVNINHASPSEIAKALQRAGFSEDEASQIAVNIVDFRDEDNNPTEYRGKYGIEETPYINEIMPNFTSSVIVAVSDLAKGGIKYLKDKATEEVKRKIKEKVGKDVPFVDKIIDEIASTGEEELGKEVDKIIEKYKRRQRTKKEEKFIFFTFFRAKPVFAEEKISVTMDIQIEWVELYNPYSFNCSLPGWKIKTSLREKMLFGIVPSEGYWVVLNIIIKLPEKTIGKELLDNFVDTVELINPKGQTVDKVTYYNYGFPWRAWEKNDPRVREFAGFVPGGSPWFRNWHWMPEVGEVTAKQVKTSFYVKNKPFASVGELGYIHSGKQWRTINLDKNGQWTVLDKFTITWPPNKPSPGKININTATKNVLQALPGIDSQIAEQIIDYCDSKNGPFDEIGEIAQVRGMQKLGFNGWDDDGDGYVDEDDEKEAILRGISNLITVRSNCFTVISLGRVIRGGKVVAEKKIKAIVDRGCRPIKIKYYREMYEED